MKKIILFLLTASIIVSAFSCASSSETQNNSDNNKSTQNVSAGNDTSTVETTAETNYFDNLPEMNLNGRSIRIISRITDKSHDVQMYTDFGNNEIDAEALDGTQINDAVYNRNRELEGRYNFVFESIQIDMNPAATAKTSMLANSDDFDLVIDALLPMVPLTGENLLYNLNNAKYLDLSKPYWDHNANSNLSIGGNHYLAIGDLLILDKKGTWSTLFNKELREKYDLDDPYQLVRDGKWTIDKMYDMAKAVSMDLDGDGDQDENDQWGYLTESYNAGVHMFGCETRFTSKDADDYPVLDLYNERSVSAFEKVFALMTDKFTTLNNANSPNGAADTLKAFGESRALFYMVGIGTAMEYRYMDADFGILPIPKYDETQENYYTILSIYNSACVGIPNCNGNPDEVSFALEAICAASTNTLKSTFYDVVLSGVTVRDEESRDMLDIIFNNRVFDIGFTYNWGNMNSIYSNLIAKNSNDLSSGYASVEKAANKAMSKAIEQFKEYNQ